MRKEITTHEPLQNSRMSMTDDRNHRLLRHTFDGVGHLVPDTVSGFHRVSTLMPAPKITISGFPAPVSSF